MANRFDILPRTQELTNKFDFITEKVGQFFNKARESVQFTPPERPELKKGLEKFIGGSAELGEAIIEFPGRPVRETLEARGFSPLLAGVAGFIADIATPLPGGEIKSIDTALSKLVSAIKTAKPIGKEIITAQSAERSARVGKASGILEKGQGEKAFFQAKGALKGPLVEKPRFEPLRTTEQQVSKELEPLAQEARKYKSAEEFVEAQTKITDPKLNAEGFRVTGGRNNVLDPQADKYNPFFGKTDKSVTVYRAAKPEAGDIKLRLGDFVTTNKERAAQYGNVKTFQVPENQLRIADPEFRAKGLHTKDDLIFDNKSQLTDFYNQAVGGTEKAGEKLAQGDIEELVGMIQKMPTLTTFEKINAFDGLNDILGGSIPQPHKLSLLEDVFGKDLVEATLQHRSNLEKWKDIGINLANLPRAVMSSFDLSFGGRQGIFAAPTHAKEFFGSWTKQFKMFGSEKAYLKTMEEVAQNPDYLLAKESGLSFTKVGQILADREEAFATNWTDKIPLLRGSSRAYTGFANKFRMDIFSSLVKDAKNVGLDPYKDKELSKKIGELVNTMTGRGGLPAKLQRVAPMLNALFFSPRLMASRLNLLNPLTYTQSEPFVRKQAIKSLIGFGGYITTVLTLAKLSGAEVGLDPRSSDFAKIKVGNTRFDVMGGFQQYIRMAAQLVMGKYVSSTTGKVITLGEGYKPLTRFDILLRQIESKEAPIFSFITDLLRQQDYKGEKISVTQEVIDRFTPMVWGDLHDLAKDDPELLPWGILGIFGVGVQTYEGKPIKSRFNF